MFLYARRPVVVHSAVPLDEGRASEYYEHSTTALEIAGDDFRLNRIPEVLVQDHEKKQDSPMSFHDIHLLGTQAVFQMIVTPRAYVHNNRLGWEFRLVTLKVLGKKRMEIASSPTKQVLKRKAVYLNMGEPAEGSSSTNKRAKTAG
ncbi:hypothetical protein D9757_011248 [Collybiopsis confluens]|uniref:Uncharacterized protein n=1 Tax=Collybiopsis confluens TaxID=2823264 RepID=A0A8H5LSJ5_9AGAR|nr:hypothetical protein D9757_011248 [Collybiopsis confluens]